MAVTNGGASAAAVTNSDATATATVRSLYGHNRTASRASVAAL